MALWILLIVIGIVSQKWLFITGLQLSNHNKLSFVDSQESFTRAVNELKICSEIGLDLEFDRERYSYGLTLCLIQIQGHSCSYVFDPFTISDLTPLYNILEDDKVLKILHSPSEDLRILHRSNCFPTNIFDTETAAKLLDMNQLSLSALLSNCLNVTLDKTLQKSNWYQRPLSTAQIKYAASDVIHLFALRDHLLQLARMKSYDVLNWITIENKNWDTFREVLRSEDELFLTKDDIKYLNPYERFVLNEVLRIRDKYARMKDKPSNQIISKDYIKEIIFGNRNFLYSCKDYRSIHPVMRRYEVLEEFQICLDNAHKQALERGLSLPEIETNSATKKLDRLQKELELAQLELALQQKFYPVHSVLVKRFGEYTANYLLSKTLMTKIVKKELTFDEIPFQYRRDLFKEIIAELHIESW